MDAPVKVGDILASKYRVESILGAGAMGVVVAARHVQLGSLVALKFMLPETHKVQGATDRFIREARAAARLRGEHVARVMDFGALENGAAYIVMEFLEGRDLQDIVDERGRLPLREAIQYVLDVCKAMDEAHRAGIVHRDLKPKNLFLTQRPDGTPLVKVLDFGVSKVADGSDDLQVSTRAGAILGSPAFMSPEQIRGSKSVDARADIYAIGIVLHYLLTKRFPYDAETIGDLYGAVLYKEPYPLSASRPDASVALESVVSRCLRKDPDARFSSARELMAALLGALELSSAPASADMAQVDTVADRAEGPGAVVPLQGTLSHASMAARDAAASKSKVAPVVWAGVALVAVALAAAGAISLRRSPPASSASSTPVASSPEEARPIATAVRSAEAPAVPVVENEPSPVVTAPVDAAVRPAGGSKADGGARRPRTNAPNLPHGDLYE